MQQFKSTWYFAFGSPEKTSLCTQFCRENNFVHFMNPKVEDLSKCKDKHAIIQGTLQLFKQVQKIKPELSIILVGKPVNKEQKLLCQQYQKIGRLKKSPTYKYEQFRKKIFPNIIFVYGPVARQTRSAAYTLAVNIGYVYSDLARDSNDYISHIDKSQNYVVNGLFQDSKQIKILHEFFQIKVIHLKYNRVDLPDCNQYFDKEYNLVNFLKDKSYYIPIDATASQVKILDQIGIKLCPRLIYANTTNANEVAHLQKYIEHTDGLLLNFQQIQNINKKKNLPLYGDTQSKILYLSSIFYKDLNKKQIVLSYYPWALKQILALENLNRKISLFVDLSEASKFQYQKQFSTPTYFLQNQKYIRPNHNNSLKNQLQQKVEYWLVAGAPGAGKSTVAKFLSTQFGYKLIQFQPYLASVKQKLIAPQDGEQLPARKAIQHFRQILTNDKQAIYVIDGLPYANKDLQNWIAAIGAPNVIQLQVETIQQIKRARKKAEADVNAEVNQQQSNKAKQSTEKNRVWIQSLSNIAPSSSIYKLDYNDPQIKVENIIKKIIRPRIYLVQKNNTYTYQNIAIKYGLGFVNLNKLRLRDAQKSVKNSKKRDIILCNHGHQKKRMTSEDLYWIEKNLGQIRYVGIWESQVKQIMDQPLELQRPQVPQKPKAAEGEAGEQKPPEDPPAAQGDANKKKFDIYDFQWTKPGDYKNLSQWFFKSKTHITQFENSPQNCFKNFLKVFDKLNENSENNVYEKVK